jgi:hypothetical protein
MSIEMPAIRRYRATPRQSVSRGTRALCLAGLLGLMLGPSSAIAAPELTTPGGPLTVHAVQGADTAQATLPILNTGDAPAEARVDFQASSSGSASYQLAPPTTIAPGQATSVKLTFTGLASLRKTLTGVVVISGGAKPVAQPVTMIPAIKPSNDWPTLIVCISIGIALILMASIAAEVAGGKVAPGGSLDQLLRPAPSPKLAYSSWASHVTVFGALLTTVLASSTLPEVPEQIDKNSLVGLSLLFAGLIVIAPFVFEAIQSPSANRLTKSKVAPQAESEGGSGVILVLILSCGLTLGAVVGQIATIGLATWEIVGEHNTVRIAIEASLGLLAALAVYYVLLEASKAASTDWHAAAAKRKQDGDAQPASWALP